MPTDGATTTPEPLRSVFLSYASEDREAAQVIRDALPALGLEAWYDESALDGGDVWDQKIRREIRECDFFMPLISAQTESRSEGYFRREWRLAVERTLDMSDDRIFLLPIVIDETKETGARVPEKFLTVQWMWLPGGKPTPAFEALCRRLAAGQTLLQPSSKKARGPAPAGPSPSSVDVVQYPEFPKQDPQHKAQFYGRAGLWVAQSAWLSFKRLPRWVRALAYVWACILLVKACHTDDDRPTRKVTPAEAKKLKEIADNYRTSGGDIDVGKLAATIAKSFPAEAGRPAAAHSPLLAIPFTAPSGDANGQKLADSTFAQVFGRVSLSHRGEVGLPGEPVAPPGDLSAALQRGREQHASYILYGVVDQPSATQSLSVKLVEVADGSVSWSGSYLVSSADAARVAAEVDAKIPSLDDD